MPTLKYHFVIIAYALSFPHHVFANDDSTELNTIHIQGQRHHKLGEKQETERSITEQMIQDEYDLVRYNTSINVVEGGRAGSNGFNIRGVEKDRVAITIDGLEQAESKTSEGFELIFAGYGNFNNVRNTTEIENMRHVNVIKGAESVNAGSGGLGGAIMYQTKSARDYLSENKPYYANIKTGYSSKNRQKMFSSTLAAKLLNLDALFVYTKRDGHETKNFGNGNNENIETTIDYRSYEGIFRAKPDPQNIQFKSTLLKLGYYFNEHNYLNWIYEDYRQDRQTDELSNLWSSWDDTELRRRFDVSYRKRIGWRFENNRDQGIWDKLTLSLDRQKIQMSTITWDMPKSPETSSRNKEMLLRDRGLFQNLDQLTLKAEKYAQWQHLTWSTSYGGGYAKGKNTNNNHEYMSYVFYPGVLASNISTHKNFIQAKNKHLHLIWDNKIYLKQWQFQIGTRYDRYQYQTIDDPLFNKRMAADNILHAKPSFSALSWSLGAGWNMTPHLTLQTKYNTAFRAPTVDEMWFNFPHPDFQVLANPNLKPEKAHNLEIGFNWHGHWGNLQLSGFRSRYTNFIDFAYLGQQGVRYWNESNNTYNPPTGSSATYQNINRQKAIVQGIELQGHWQLNYLSLPQGSFASLSLTYIQGKADNHIPINAIQPFNAVIGLGYEQPEQRWSLKSYISYFARKKAKDTILDNENTHQPWPYTRFSNNIWLVDIIGHYRINKHFTLRAGIFNLFNKEYYTWNSLRSIRPFGTVNVIDDKTGKGITRFSAPGRNFSITLNAEF